MDRKPWPKELIYLSVCEARSFTLVIYVLKALPTSKWIILFILKFLGISFDLKKILKFNVAWELDKGKNLLAPDARRFAHSLYSLEISVFIV